MFPAMRVILFFISLWNKLNVYLLISLHFQVSTRGMLAPQRKLKVYIDNYLLRIQLTYKISLELEIGDNLWNF